MPASTEVSSIEPHVREFFIKSFNNSKEKDFASLQKILARGIYLDELMPTVLEGQNGGSILWELVKTKAIGLDYIIKSDNKNMSLLTYALARYFQEKKEIWHQLADLFLTENPSLLIAANTHLQLVSPLQYASFLKDDALCQKIIAALQKLKDQDKACSGQVKLATVLETLQ